MSKIKAAHVFTSESVGKGHPDKLCDQISDAILDACLSRDHHSRVACETMAGFNLVVNVGEITCRDFETIDTEKIARDTVKQIGYDHPELRFYHDSFEYLSRIHGQSPDISQGVTEGEGLYEEQGAGDQGMMFGYATNETPEMLPVSIAISHRLLMRLEELRKNGTIDYLRPDAKAQVSVQYDGGRPRGITSVVVSHQTSHVSAQQIRKDITDVIRQALSPSGLLSDDTEYYINPTGSFINENAIQGVLEDRALFDFRPAAIIDQLKLLDPQGWSYAQTAAYDHFGRDCFPWEKTDKAEILKQVFKNIKAA